MAEEQDNNQNQESQERRKKSLPLKTGLLLLVVLLIEAAVISLAFIFAGGPSPVQAEQAAADELAKAEKPVEVLVVTDRFQNVKTGRTYIYDTEIWARIRYKHQEAVEQNIEELKASLTAEIAEVFRKADPGHLLDPTLSTLRRQIKAVLDERLGFDEEGEPVVEEVLITKYTQFRADI